MVWTVHLTEADVESERAWLKANVYGGRSVELELETLDARVGYSGGRGGGRGCTLDLPDITAR